MQIFIQMQTIDAGHYLIVFNEVGVAEINKLIESKKYSSLFIICDENSHTHCVASFLGDIANELKIEIIEIEAGEELKNISTCVDIWNTLAELGADRKSLIINVGGGVVTDIGGFIAATFKRGLDFINVPTTLLAMVDASVGGKNGVDLGNLKNQIGTIVNPEMVYINTSYLNTLPQRQIISGYAEMLKHGLIYDDLYWQKCAQFSQINFNDLNNLIHQSVQIKHNIVAQDPYEHGIRKALNFGHTLGHAIESYFLESQKPLLHGEAIAVGMILESFLSKEKNTLTDQSYLYIKTTLKKIYNLVTFTKNDIDSIIELLVHDKKNEYGQVQFVLLDGVGAVHLNQNVDNSAIFKAFADYIID